MLRLIYNIIIICIIHFNITAQIIEIVNKEINQPIYYGNCDMLGPCVYLADNSYLALATPIMIGFSYKADEDMYNQAQTMDQTYYKYITYLGSGIVNLGIGASIYGYGEWSNDNYLSETGIKALEAVALGGITTLLIKVIVGRARPYTEEGTTSYKPFSINTSYNSFPSGHTTTAFALATVLAQRYKHGYIAYLPAVLVAISRIVLNKHYLSDTIAGAIVGYTAASIITNSYAYNRVMVYYPSIDNYNDVHYFIFRTKFFTQ